MCSMFQLFGIAIIVSSAANIVSLILKNVLGQYHKTPISFLKNRIIGTPSVECSEDVVTLDFNSDQPFTGNLFVKGKSRDPSCTKSFSKLAQSKTTYSLPLGRCGMQRLRSANPRGMSFTITLIISFHPIFLTKGDRAYHVRCFYMEPDEIVSVALDVSMMATNTLTDRLAMPICEYTVRRDSPNGAIVSFANIGETVYHVWECKGPDMGIMVKKCFVNDGRGDEVEVIDYDGCVVDLLLLGSVTYDTTLMRAHAPSHVFRYQDASELFFTCQIRLCQKNMGLCEGITPPKCSKSDKYHHIRAKSSHETTEGHEERTSKEYYPGRRKRTLEGVGLDNLDGDIVDVITSEMTIIGLDYNINASKVDNLKRTALDGFQNSDMYRPLSSDGSVCLTPGWVSFVVLCALFTILSCIIIGVWLYRHNTLKTITKFTCGLALPEP